MKTTKKNLALLELILVILFFALSSVVLAQVFVEARAMSDASRASTLGLVEAQNLAERLKAAPWDAEQTLAGWTREEPGPGGGLACTAGYGGDMRPAAEEAAYTVRAAVWPEPRAAGTLYRIQVSIDRLFDQENIIRLETSRYVSANEEETP